MVALKKNLFYLSGSVKEYDFKDLENGFVFPYVLFNLKDREFYSPSTYVSKPVEAHYRRKMIIKFSKELEIYTYFENLRNYYFSLKIDLSSLLFFIPFINLNWYLWEACFRDYFLLKKKELSAFFNRLMNYYGSFLWVKGVRFFKFKFKISLKFSNDFLYLNSFNDLKFSNIFFTTIDYFIFFQWLGQIEGLEFIYVNFKKEAPEAFQVVDVQSGRGCYFEILVGINSFFGLNTKMLLALKDLYLKQWGYRSVFCEDIEELSSVGLVENYYNSLEFPYTYNFFILWGGISALYFNDDFTSFFSFDGLEGFVPVEERLNVNFLDAWRFFGQSLKQKQPKYYEKYIWQRHLRGPGRREEGAMNIIYVWELYLLVHNLVYVVEEKKFKKIRLSLKEGKILEELGVFHRNVYANAYYDSSYSLVIYEPWDEWQGLSVLREKFKELAYEVQSKYFPFQLYQVNFNLWEMKYMEEAYGLVESGAYVLGSAFLQLKHHLAVTTEVFPSSSYSSSSYPLNKFF